MPPKRTMELSRKTGDEKAAIYLDANASSRLRPIASEAIARFLDNSVESGNPSSIHAHGRLSRGLLATARKQIARSLGFRAPSDLQIVFTSGGTEGCNAIIAGAMASDRGSAPVHVVSSTIEHPAVLEPLRKLIEQGDTVTLVDPDSEGFVSVAAVAAAVRNDTVLVIVMAANNETGAIQPIREIAQQLRTAGYRGIIASDCTQFVGKSAVTMSQLFDAGVDVVAFSGHKLGAPSGIGVVAYRQATDLCHVIRPLLVGGPQEGGLRGGTENLLGAIALGAVADALSTTLKDDISRTSALRERLWTILSSAEPEILRLSPIDLEEPGTKVVSNTLLVRFPGCRADDLAVALDLAGVAASAGAACASGKQQPSYVVQAMGLGTEAARESIRFSLDWDADEELIDRCADIILSVVRRMRARGVGERSSTEVAAHA